MLRYVAWQDKQGMNELFNRTKHKYNSHTADDLYKKHGSKYAKK
jgi:hypothetical protein